MADKPWLEHKELRDGLLDICERAEDADVALQEYWPALEEVVNDEIREHRETAMSALEFINKINRDLFGGEDVRMRCKRERAEEEGSDYDDD